MEGEVQQIRDILISFPNDIIAANGGSMPTLNIVDADDRVVTSVATYKTKDVKNNPALIGEAAKRYGDQCVVLSADIKRVDGVFRVFAKGGRENTGMEAIEWIKRCVDNGAGEVVVNSIDTDGVRGGFDHEMLGAVCEAVSVPVIASGGAGNIEHFITRMGRNLGQR